MPGVQIKSSKSHSRTPFCIVSLSTLSSNCDNHISNPFLTSATLISLPINFPLASCLEMKIFPLVLISERSHNVAPDEVSDFCLFFEGLYWRWNISSCVDLLRDKEDEVEEEEEEDDVGEDEDEEDEEVVEME